VSWQDWCHELAPDDIDLVHALGRLKARDVIKLEALFRSHSTLLLVSLPILIWDRLPRSLAYSFIAFIKSPNMVLPSWDLHSEACVNALTYREHETRVKTIEDQSEFDYEHQVGNKQNRQMVTKTALAMYYEKQGRWKESEKLFKEIVFARRSALGEEHPDTLASMTNLASAYQNQGRWDAAEELEVQVMDTSTKKLGADHPSTLISIANLASTYWNQGRWKEAEELEVQVMETRTRVLGDEHPDTLISMHNLAFTLQSHASYHEACVLMERCLQLRQQILGEQHPDTQSSLDTLNSWRAEFSDKNPSN
jgi:tetratricopeptide (TPR) repeat protein